MARSRSLEAGADVFLLKPLQPDKLAETVGYLLYSTAAVAR